MSDIEQKALALVNEVRRERNAPLEAGLCRNLVAAQEALCRAIDRHEADKRAFAEERQRVSDAVEYLLSYQVKPKDCAHGMSQVYVPSLDALKQFIIKPVDPLIEAFEESTGEGDASDWAARFRAALSRHGLSIVKGDE